MLHSVTSEAFRQQYASVFEGDERWQKLPVPTGDRFAVGRRVHLRPQAAVPRRAVDDAAAAAADLREARALAVLGDSITTDHISPAGNIKANSPAGKYLIEHGVEPKDFNSYGARRGNHEVMMRGTFANTRIKNQMVPGHRRRRDTRICPAAK